MFAVFSRLVVIVPFVQRESNQTVGEVREFGILPTPAVATASLAVARKSALGHKRKWCHARVMSVLSLKADIRQREWHVRYVPVADMLVHSAPRHAKRRAVRSGTGPGRAKPAASSAAAGLAKKTREDRAL